MPVTITYFPPGHLKILNLNLDTKQMVYLKKFQELLRVLDGVLFVKSKPSLIEQKSNPNLLQNWAIGRKKNLFKLGKNVVAFLKMNLNKNQIQILCKIEPQKKKIFLNWAENVEAFFQNEFDDYWFYWMTHGLLVPMLIFDKLTAVSLDNKHRKHGS